MKVISTRPKTFLGWPDNTWDRFPSSWILGIKFAYKRVMYRNILTETRLEVPSGFVELLGPFVRIEKFLFHFYGKRLLLMKNLNKPIQIPSVTSYRFNILKKYTTS